MNKIVLSVLLFISFSAQASEWTDADKYREGVFLTVMTMDCHATRRLAKEGWVNYYESNPLLGQTPSVGRVNNTCLATAIAHVYIADNLSPEWRKAFQYTTIWVETGVLRSMISIGVKIGF